jgi:hypothetical protein
MELWVNPGLTRCTHGYVSFAAKPQPNRRIIGKTMTAPRRQRKLRLVGLGTGLLAAAAAIGGLAAPAAIRAATTELIVVDRNSGIAIGGFDPVAYFIDGVAMPGKGDFEASFAGAVWRFRNEGNRGAFLADPDTYLPRFGGYDPTGVARGAAVPGDPRLCKGGASIFFIGLKPGTCLRATPRPSSPPPICDGHPFSGPCRRRRRQMMGDRPLSSIRFDGSPQAMKAGIRKFSAIWP